MEHGTGCCRCSKLINHCLRALSERAIWSSTSKAGFRMRVLPLQNDLRRAVIHNDANRENVIVSASGNEVAGIIDFGDMMYLWLVVEPAIAATYAMLASEDPIGTAQTLLRGYHQTLPLTETEIMVALMRLQEAGRRIVLISLAEEAPPDDLGPTVTYHIPAGVSALNNHEPSPFSTEQDGSDRAASQFDRRESGNE